MYLIKSKTKIQEDVFQMEVEAPLIAEERQAGQFIILLIDQKNGERIPLTIAGADREKGTITIIFQAVGDSTKILGKKEAGDYIDSLLGPLGTPTHIEKYDKPVVCVGGGIGVAPLRPIVEAMKEAGNEVISRSNKSRQKELSNKLDEIQGNKDQVLELLLKKEIDLQTFRRKVDALDSEMASIRERGNLLDTDYSQIIYEVGEFINELRDRPSD